MPIARQGAQELLTCQEVINNAHLDNDIRQACAMKRNGVAGSGSRLPQWIEMLEQKMLERKTIRSFFKKILRLEGSPRVSLKRRTLWKDRRLGKPWPVKLNRPVHNYAIGIRINSPQGSTLRTADVWPTPAPRPSRGVTLPVHERKS